MKNNNEKFSMSSGTVLLSALRVEFTIVTIFGHLRKFVLFL